MRTNLDVALQYYGEHGRIMFWNPRDITPENLSTATPDAEALVIKPGNITSSEIPEGQYLVKDGNLEQYDPYPGHEGIAKIFAALKHSPPLLMSDSAIRRSVRMGWVIMEAVDGKDGIYFKRYNPPPPKR